MADVYTYTDEDGFTFSSEDRAKVRNEARNHRTKAHGENPPEPQLIDAKIARKVG